MLSSGAIHADRSQRRLVDWKVRQVTSHVRLTPLIAFVNTRSFILNKNDDHTGCSVAILSDAAHMLSDVSAFMVSVYASWAALQPATQRYTYGYRRVEIIGALASVLAIWLVTGALVYEAVSRMFHPVLVDGQRESCRTAPRLSCLELVCMLVPNKHIFASSNPWIRIATVHSPSQATVTAAGMLYIACAGIVFNLMIAAVLRGGHAHHDAVQTVSADDVESRAALLGRQAPQQSPLRGSASDNINVRSAVLHVLGTSTTDEPC